jgi:uncharacterized membrane protein
LRRFAERVALLTLIWAAALFAAQLLWRFRQQKEDVVVVAWIESPDGFYLSFTEGIWPILAVVLLLLVPPMAAAWLWQRRQS